MPQNLYPVKIDWIPNLPQISYRGGVGMYEGVVMHDTCSPNDTAAGERIYEGRTFSDAFVHEFIDPNEIVQVANPNYIAWGAGSNANPRFIHLELCSANSQDEFERGFDMWCQRAAFYLYTRGLPVIPAQSDGTGTLWGHFEVSGYLGGTDHMDPIDTLKQWGKTWDDVCVRVEQHYQTMKTEDEEMALQDEVNQLKAKVETLQKQLADTQNLLKMPAVPDWAKDAVAAAAAKGLIDSPVSGSYDFYRLVTVLHRNRII